jgi:hypothetical protein
MNLNSIWSVLEEDFDILGDYGYPAMDRAAAEIALEPGWMTWVAAIWLFGSEPFTTAQFMRMFPYGLVRLTDERFASAAQQGYLISNGANGYTSAEEGMRVAQRIWREAGDALADLTPIPDEHLQRLFNSLDRLIEASLSAPEPPPHFYISHKRDNYRQYETNYPLEDFVVRFGVLAAYRDDAHSAAWLAHQITGHAWEILTCLWRCAATASVEQLREKVGYRSIPMEVYVQDLKELAVRGWIKEDAGAYQLTADGQRIREEAEALTDRYFFAPWACLNEPELEELLSLASQLLDSLKK